MHRAPGSKNGRFLLPLLDPRLAHVVLALPSGSRAVAVRPLPPLARLRRLRVDRLRELVRGALERIRGVADARRILGLERLLGVGERALDVAPSGGVERRAVL